MSRRGTAQVVAPPPDADQVHFGSTVVIEYAGGRRRTWRIVGEDEAEAAGDGLAYVSPLAQALMGRRLGEAVVLDDGEVIVVAIA